MLHLIPRSLLLVSLMLTSVCQASITLPENPPGGLAAPRVNTRKVYADYHSPRYTRAHDGAVGVWKYAGVARTSKLPNPAVNSNPDLIDADGRHELAATFYPLVGMQSELDPDYLEYQVLSAKTAGIDGFFVEWGFQEHSSEAIRQALTAVAARYDFEIGITLCDRWLFTQLPALQPAIKERAQLAAEFRRNYDFLRDVVFASPTTPRYRDRPVLLLFGGGLTPEEFHSLRPAEPGRTTNDPYVLVRPLLAGVSAGHAAALAPVWEKSPWYSPEDGFLAGVDGFFGWVPTRARTDALDALPAPFDRYGTLADALNYLRAIDAIPGNGPRVSCATPGFDNRTCAGWGSDFSFLPRGRGEIYQAMWKYNLAAKSVEWVYLPTWNDWTEGSQIEPSMEDGGLFLKLTAAAAGRFKGREFNPALTELPRQLFELRKRTQRLRAIGVDIDAASGARLDAVAQALARLDGTAARAEILALEAKIASLEAQLPPLERMALTTETGGLSPATPAAADGKSRRFWRMDEAAARQLRAHYYEGTLEFEYRPTGRGRLQIFTDTNRARSAVGEFGVIADLNFLQAGDWQAARVRVFHGNPAWQHGLPGDSDLEFRGDADVRQVRLIVDSYRPAH